MPEDPLDAVALWIVANGVAHVLTSAEPLRAICGRLAWRKAAVTSELVDRQRICVECRRQYETWPHRRPRLQDIQPTVERQLAFTGDWSDEP